MQYGLFEERPKYYATLDELVAVETFESSPEGWSSTETVSVLTASGETSQEMEVVRLPRVTGTRQMKGLRGK